MIASSATDGASEATLTYGVPGAGAARHIVFDAPESADGKSDVATSVNDGRCAISITAGATFAGHPLMFQVSSAADGCAAIEDLDVPPTPAPAGGNGGEVGGGGMTAGGGTTSGPGGAVGTTGGTTSSMGGAGGSTGATVGTGASGAPGHTPDVDAGLSAASSDARDLGCDCVVVRARSARGSVALGLTLLLGLSIYRRRSTRPV